MTLRIFVDLALSPEALTLLRDGAAGHELLFPQKPASSVLDKPETDPQLFTADVAFGQPDPKAIAQTTRLKWIHISTSGITRYDNAEFRSLVAQRKIQVSNSAGVYHESCALHVMGFMLAQARQLPAAMKSRAPNGSPEWLALRGSCVPLAGQTVLIVGYGTIGARLAEMLRPLGMNVLACRRKPRGDESVPVIAEHELAHTLASRADHVVNILPDSPQTRHFFDAARFAAIKPGAVFYNIGRGGTVDQDALLNTLRTGRLKAAWLDVTEPEPLPEGHPLWKEPNCFITPHIAGGHFEETKTLLRHFLENLKRFSRGEALMDRIM
jgi:phosphoglycerate dehydrogenase-like enzyme